MFPEYLKTEQPFATKLFSAAIEKNRLAHAYLFTKGQPIVQYDFAMKLAKILNCPNKVNNEPCDTCTDCKWISNNTHPAIITVSPVDYTVQKGDLDDDKAVSKSKSKNQVKVDQARLLQKTLATSSKYHRVVIFTGATDEKLPAEQMDQAWLNFKERVKPPESVNGREEWAAAYLNYYSFPPETANMLLKSIEEPYGKVLFLFITKDSDDMITTIVSRCQIISLLRQKDLEIEPVDYLQEIASYLPPQNELDSLRIAKKLLDFSKTEQIAIEKVLEYIEMLYRKQLLEHVNNDTISKLLIKYINKIESTKSMLKNYVNPQAALISMLNELITP